MWIVVAVIGIAIGWLLVMIGIWTVLNGNTQQSDESRRPNHH